MECMFASRLGWNQYHLVDIHTGHSHVAARYELERIPSLNTDLGDDIFEADVVVEETEKKVVGTGIGDDKHVGLGRLCCNRTENDWYSCKRIGIPSWHLSRQNGPTKCSEVHPPFWPAHPWELMTTNCHLTPFSHINFNILLKAAPWRPYCFRNNFLWFWSSPHEFTRWNARVSQ